MNSSGFFSALVLNIEWSKVHGSTMTLTEARRLPGIRFGLLVVVYTFVLTGSQRLAYELRFDFNIPPDERLILQMHWPWIVALKLLVFGFCGQFAGLLSYFSIPDLRRVLYASTISSLILLSIRYYSPGFYPAPRGAILLDFFFSFAGLVTVRLALRMIRERYLLPQSRPTHQARRVAIIGAGDVGAALARELLTKRGLGLHPVAFFDDDKTKWRSRMHDIPVVGPPERLLDQKLNLELEEVIIAMPSAPAKRIGEIVKLLQRARLKFETVPSMDQLATGQIKVTQLRSIEIQDLLGRHPVELETENIREILQGRVVMVTGAGGSIGSELCRQIASFGPQRMLLVDQSEVQAFPIEQELIESGFGEIVHPVVADIRDLVRIRSLFRRFAPTVVFHAAAHKHVPMMEGQPSEAIRNNTLGTANLAELALEFGVDRFVLVSTDKAINPTNVMGATKRLAEIFLQSLHASVTSHSDSFRSRGDETLTKQPQEQTKDPGDNQFQSPLTSPPTRKTKFIAVRFGNVLGSSGSVIPIFNKQIAAGGPVKVTHPEVTRYFMTIPEASGLVLQSAAQGSGGEIFVLDMGKPVKIVDLARQLIELSGLRPDEDIEIVFTGLRPGEKLFEELSHKGENITPTQHPKVMRFVCEPLPLKEVRDHLEQLSAALNVTEPDQLKLMLKKAVPEYQPYMK
jgi:FlaA1/EpsC-like NDP-sugar epimerase